VRSVNEGRPGIERAAASISPLRQTNQTNFATLPAMTNVTRREFLQNASLTALAAPLTATPLLRAGTSASGAPGKPQVKFPTSPRDRIAVASYPFRELVAGQHDDKSAAAKKLALKEFPAHVAAKFGIHKIEPWSEHFLSTDAAYLDEIRNAAAKSGTSFVNIAADNPDSLYSPDAAVRERATQFCKRWIDVAAHLGSPSIRLNIRVVKDIKPEAAPLVERIKGIAAYTAFKNVVMHLENDNPISEDPFFVAALLDKINSPWVRALADFGNSVVALPAEDAYRGLDEMFAHAYAISHVKDGEVNSANNVARVDIPRVFAIAKKNSYKGFFSMEYELNGDPYAGTSNLIEGTVKNLS
jgi:sugar phosphate isomerase/epimerase